MSKLPRVDGRRLVRIFGPIGFEVVRVRGSHRFLRHADGSTTVIPVQVGESTGPVLLNRILADRDLSRDEFKELL